VTPKCRASILTLNIFDHDWDGADFDSEETARRVLKRERVFRTRVNSLRASAIYVLESLPAE
jgi:hypothetical protein